MQDLGWIYVFISLEQGKVNIFFKGSDHRFGFVDDAGSVATTDVSRLAMELHPEKPSVSW